MKIKKACNKCGDIKLLVEFHKNKNCKDGVDSKCKVCRNNARRNRLTRRFRDWMYGANRRGIRFDLTLEDLDIIPKVCHYTGKELTLESNRINTLSLDRLDSTLGYSRDNVVFCCEYINKMKNDLGYIQFIDVCREIADFCKNKQINRDLKHIY